MTDRLLLIDKPVGWTSHDVVAKLRGILKMKRIGHAGTLDPFATGLLVIGVGPGTKDLTALVGVDKTYIATARLGATSTTEDPEGEITETGAAEVSRTDLESVLNTFVGTYEQTASLYSAKKVGGKKLYDLARQGLGDTVERPKKMVTISELKLLEYAWPNLTFEVSCSSGTYVRALARDIGEKLGVGAYLTALRRTRIGDFRIEDAKKLEDVRPLD
ncbi:tRNA pseudouridine(55) synthase TruB [Patescibacteria group bacterium]|jgi:tRNA pseudouridine55 synthase|nr:tRNA pseudouridine(55) synthase TruB [Patescibacteria group bacterium]